MEQALYTKWNFLAVVWILNILHHVSKDGVSWALAITVSIMTGINQIIIFRNNKKNKT